MGEVGVIVKSVTKKFRLHQERNRTIKEKLLYRGRSHYREFVALDNVSLTIQRGTATGLIGSNGSGKSTLLKLLSRIIYPDSGNIEIHGKVSSLLELGAGFHPEFTGLENIFLNAALMGLSKKEIRYQLDNVIDFSELGSFINEPIRSYSSGMYMRLAFSVAISVNPDVLLIDEILAVGDASFQQKCLDRLQELRKKNVTIVMVSHSNGLISDFCDEAVWLEKSKIRALGSPDECLEEYMQFSRV